MLSLILLPCSLLSSSARYKKSIRVRNRRVSSWQVIPMLSNLKDPTSVLSLQYISPWQEIHLNCIVGRAKLEDAKRSWAYRGDEKSLVCHRTTPKIASSQLKKRTPHQMNRSWFWYTPFQNSKSSQSKQTRALLEYTTRRAPKNGDTGNMHQTDTQKQAILNGTQPDSTVDACSAAVFPSSNFSFKSDSSVTNSSSLRELRRSRLVPPSPLKYDALGSSSFIWSMEWIPFSACSARWRNSWRVASSSASPFGFTLSRTEMHLR